MRTVIFIAMCFVYGILFAGITRLLGVEMDSIQTLIIIGYVLAGAAGIHFVDAKLKARQGAKKQKE